MKKILITFGLIIAIVGSFITAAGIYENKAYADSAADLIKQGADSTGQQDSRSAGDIAKDVVNIMFFIVGIMAVIMIIWGGIRYVLSAGNSAALTSAKNTIMYAVIGLIVAILAYTIVNFVINTVSGNSGSSSSNSSNSSDDSDSSNNSDNSNSSNSNSSSKNSNSSNKSNSNSSSNKSTNSNNSNNSNKSNGNSSSNNKKNNN